ncbi:lmo1851 family serine protease [Planococcus lenghuensis]|uniref:Peptidase S41 n=1 Tax=Planococcus lenghuensis TaxID=2213202 RepID=A0A1Q2KZG0_9BACL|nr:S41 family peptidase [Planococcus lenghuensis]AQQ53514.1 peptidase S41 [Planococcus lenghuensis]
MNEQRPGQDQTPAPEETPANSIRMRTFQFIMLIFFLVLATAGLTVFALTFGEEKAVEVGAPARQEFQKLFSAYDQLQSEYYTEVESDALINGAINGMVEALDDPYSDYLSQEEATQFMNSISSSFEGIGAEIQERDGLITVVSPIANSPAEEAGILPGDKILSVDGESIQGMSVTDAVMLIRGEKGTEVTLTIQRGDSGNTIDLTVERDEIPLETVYAEMISENVAHIRITSFSQDTYTELVEALANMEEAGMEALVLDVRGNPGGLLTTAREIADLFVEEGEILFQVEPRNQESEIFRATGGDKIDVPVTLLIDGGSASASEILAGALSESADVTLVGENSFGKGTVQTANDLPDGANLKFTTAKWLTPDGNWIHETGIAPDVEIGYPAYMTLPLFDTEAELKEGVISEEVEVAEQMLQAIGYEVGEVDGLFDETLTEAVETFQEDNELEVTGILTGDTSYAVIDALREKIENDDPLVQRAVEVIVEEAGLVSEPAAEEPSAEDAAEEPADDQQTEPE